MKVSSLLGHHTSLVFDQECTCQIKAILDNLTKLHRAAFWLPSKDGDSAQAADVKRVVEFCRENRPQAIFVGARNLNCKALKEDVSRIGDFILDAHAQVGNSRNAVES